MPCRPRTPGLIISVFILLLTGCTAGPELESAQVVDVVDGDTVVTARGDEVRLLDVNAPERGRAGYDAAHERLQELVLNQSVQLEAGYDERDRYGRKLRYVYYDGELINTRMVEDGLATTYFLSDIGRHRDELRGAEAEARRTGRGIWMRSPVNDCITVTGFDWDPEGNDHHNLTAEAVTFRNSCNTSIDMSGWRVKDAGTNEHMIDMFMLAPGTAVMLHTGPGTDDADDLYWGRGQAVWNNDGDSVFLRDGNGLLVAYARYPD